MSVKYIPPQPFIQHLANQLMDNDMKLGWMPRLNNNKMLTLHILFQVVLLGKVLLLWKVIWSNYQLTGSVLLFLVLVSFIPSERRYNFYNYLELYSTLFEIGKRFSTDSQNPLNNQNLLNIFCQSALSLSSIKPTKLSQV